MVGYGASDGEVFHGAAVDIAEEALIVASRDDEISDGVVAAVEMAKKGTVLGANRGPQVKDVVLLPTTRSAMESEVNVGRQFEVEVAAAVGDSHARRGIVGCRSEESLVGVTIITRPLVDDGAEFL